MHPPIHGGCTNPSGTSRPTTAATTPWTPRRAHSPPRWWAPRTALSAGWRTVSTLPAPY